MLAADHLVAAEQIHQHLKGKLVVQQPLLQL